MKPEILRIARCFCEKPGNIVFIFDEDWKCVWKNCSYDGENFIQELLHVSKNCWDNIEKQVYWKGDCLDCKMICSKEDKFRAVTLTVAKNSDDSLLDYSAIDAIISMKSLVDEVENNEHAKGWHEQDEKFMRMRGNLYPMYRPFYIGRILNRLEIFAEDNPLLKVNSELHEIYEEAKVIFGSYAETEFVSDEKEFFIYENKELFCAAILSGIVLCCKDPRQRQKLEITLHYTDNEATILINMITLKEMREDWQVQGSTQCYTETFGEEKLLNIFCGRHNGSWNLLNSNENNEISTCCKITFQSDEVSKLRFNSPSIPPIDKEKFYSIYRVMLARICVKHDS